MIRESFQKKIKKHDFYTSVFKMRSKIYNKISRMYNAKIIVDILICSINM